jgi:hypothetical protein
MMSWHQGGGDIKDFVTTCDSAKAFVIKSVTMIEEKSKTMKKCVTSFVDDPLRYDKKFRNLYFSQR